MAILTIARLTLHEASRRRLLIAVAILTVIVAVMSGWGFHRLLALPCGSSGAPHSCSPTEQKILAATLVMLIMFMFSFILALGAAFVGAPSISADAESGVLLSLLPRPIRRSDVILGKWLGLGTLILVYATITCGMEFAICKIAVNYVPPHPILAIAFLVGEALVVLSLSLAASTRLAGMTSGIIVLVLFGVIWMCGIVGGVGAVFNSPAVEDVGTVSSLIFPSDGLWRGAIYNLEPAVMIASEGAAGRSASGNPFYVAAPAAGPYVLWAVAWVLGALGLATWSFYRRDL